MRTTELGLALEAATGLRDAVLNKGVDLACYTVGAGVRIVQGRVSATQFMPYAYGVGMSLAQAVEAAEASIGSNFEHINNDNAPIVGYSTAQDSLDAFLIGNPGHLIRVVRSEVLTRRCIGIRLGYFDPNKPARVGLGETFCDAAEAALRARHFIW